MDDSDMDDVTREIYEERAAILEFCAGYSRRDAERIAREQAEKQQRLRI